MLETEFLKARKIQMASLPRKQPRVAGLEIYGKTIPATEVGGDYFDYLKPSRTRFGVIVADVSGKGMPAAMYVQRMQGIVQSTRKRLTRAEDILRELQEQMHESLDTASFITAVVALFDLEKRTVQISQAGHLPVLFIRGSTIRLLKPRGIWIGKSSTETFQKHLRSESFEIRTDDRFVFYSDGVIEANNARGNEFGLPRLRKLLRRPNVDARRLVNRCFSEVKNFSGNRPQSDDITVVAVRVVNHHNK
jgi:sigma-B regulation protein RsbU (phosphoserine phosphatase)